MTVLEELNVRVVGVYANDGLLRHRVPYRLCGDTT